MGLENSLLSLEGIFCPWCVRTVIGWDGDYWELVNWWVWLITNMVRLRGP